MFLKEFQTFFLKQVAPPDSKINPNNSLNSVLSPQIIFKLSQYFGAAAKNEKLIYDLLI
jgi:hypothetical protein